MLHVQRPFIYVSATYILPSLPLAFPDDFIMKNPRLYCPYFVYYMADTLFIIKDGSIWLKKKKQHLILAKRLCRMSSESLCIISELLRHVGCLFVFANTLMVLL